MDDAIDRLTSITPVTRQVVAAYINAYEARGFDPEAVVQLARCAILGKIWRTANHGKP